MLNLRVRGPVCPTGGTIAYIELGSAHVMLEEVGGGRNWITGPLEPPLGRGINFQITVPDADVVATALGAAGVELFMLPETQQYQVGEDIAVVRQFLVTDPDGYLCDSNFPWMAEPPTRLLAHPGLARIAIGSRDAESSAGEAGPAHRSSVQ